MKRLSHILYPLLFLLLTGLSAHAQSPEQVFAQVERAIKSGDATALSQHFNDTVEMTVEDADSDYSLTQAQFVMKEFFTNYPVQSFAFLHRGDSENMYYAVGSYVSNRGSFDANIFMRQVGSSYKIYQIRFDRNN